MANTKKNVSDSAEKEEKKTAAADSVEKENAELKNELEMLKAQMAALMATIGGNNSAKQSKRRIRFYNMMPNITVLRGTTFHTIQRQFDYVDILEAEAVNIINNMPNAIRDGIVYISDAEFVSNNDLDTVYENLLTNEQLEKLLSQNSDYAVEIYKSANKRQKKIIEDMLTTKRLDGERVDANILQSIGELCGKDLLAIKPLEE